MTATNPFRIDQFEFVSLLLAKRGATILTFTAKTDARLKKTGCPFKGVKKLATVNALVNFHYDEGVLRRLAKEGRSPDEFRRGESWHVPIIRGDDTLTPFCQHKTQGGLYLRVLALKTLEESYETEDGQVLTRADVDAWLPKDCGYENQGLDAPLVFKTYAVQNIQTITLDGQVYHVAA